MKLMLSAVILFFGFTPLPQDDLKLELGFVLPQTYLDKQATLDGKKVWIATHLSQMRPYFDQELEGINYLIGFDDKSHQIRYIRTRDKKFKTEEGFKMGDCINYSEAQIIKYPAWEIHGPNTKDGWRTILVYKKEDCWIIGGFSKGS